LETIDNILVQLESIIAESISTNNRVGYFAALYYKVTAGVKEGITKGQFENGDLMEKFDVLFANRYLNALTTWKNNQPLTASWQTTFEATKSTSALVLQQLLLGMNAHINLDLGIAAVEASNGQLDNIQKDFEAINIIISSLTYQILNDIDRFSPLLSLLGLHASNQTSILIQFSIDNARDGAWCFAEELAKKQGEDYSACISQRDQNIKKLAQGLIKTKGLMQFTIWLIHLFEWKRPSEIIKALHESSKQKIVVSQ
jgi:hypothetical protein